MIKRCVALLLLASMPVLAWAEAPRPLLWKVSDKDNSIYLLGSFHLLKPTDYPLADSTYAALADAEKVVFEMSPQEMNDPALGQRMAQAAMRTDGRTLQQSVPAATWQGLEAFATRRGLPLGNFQGYEAWFVSLVVGITEMQARGLDPSLGLDKHFAGKAADAGKPVAGLESGDQQIALFDGMDEKEQLQALEETLDEITNMEDEIGRMHELWRAGDGDALFAESGAEMKVDYPNLYERLNRGRNLAWLPHLAAMLDDSRGDDALVVVGAMHLLGTDGVVEMLRAKGYTVERL